MTAVAEHPDTHLVHDHEDGAHDHPQDRTYWKVAGLLFVLTALEVSTYWFPRFDVHPGITNVLLITLMVIKFTTVGAYFMHLKFDNLLLRRVFVFGIFLAVAVYMAMLSTFVFWNGSGTARYDDPPIDQPVPPPPTEPPPTVAVSH